jgi:hypothetical protein
MLERALTGCSFARRAEVPIGDIQVVRHVFESGFANLCAYLEAATAGAGRGRGGGRVVVPDLGCPRLGQGRG